MAVDERARHELYGQLDQALGPDATGTLMELLPPVGWADVATRHDLDALGHRVDAQIAQVRTEMADLRTDLRTEMADLRTDLRTEMADLRTDVRTEMAALRATLQVETGSLRTEFHTSMRTVLFSMLGAMFTLAGLTWAAVTLA